MGKNNIVLHTFNESGVKVGKKINALNDIRLTLMLKKLTSDSISRNELKEIVLEAKLKAQDLEVEMVLDEVFDEYFKVDVIKVDNVHQNVEQKINEYSSEGESKGTALVKRNHFNSSGNSAEDERQAA